MLEVLKVYTVFLLYWELYYKHKTSVAISMTEAVALHCLGQEHYTLV